MRMSKGYRILSKSKLLDNLFCGIELSLDHDRHYPVVRLRCYAEKGTVIILFCNIEFYHFKLF